jgi:hypothetical protein
MIFHLIFMTWGALFIEHSLHNELSLFNHLAPQSMYPTSFPFYCNLQHCLMTLLLTMHGEVNMLASTDSACCILMVSFKLICFYHQAHSFYFEPYAQDSFYTELLSNLLGSTNT